MLVSVTSGYTTVLCPYNVYILTCIKFVYTDGQKIAKKLSIQIKKETKSIRALHEEYSICQSSTNADISSTLSLSEALDPQSIGTRLQSIGKWGTIAIGKKREIIDAYLAFCRSKEEIAMLREEASSICAFYQEKLNVISRRLINFSGKNDPFSRGAKALLCNLFEKTSRHLERSKHAEEIMKTQIQQQALLTTDDCSSDECSSDYSSDEFEM